MENESWIDKIALKIAERKELGLPYDDIINEFANQALTNMSSSKTNTNNNDSSKEPDLNLVKGVNDFKMYLDCFYFKFSCCDTFDKFLQINELYRSEVRKKYYFLNFYRSIPFEVDRKILELEFNTAYSVIWSCLKWQEVYFGKSIFPYVLFNIIIDGHSTELCKELKDLILSPDNSILDFIFPPNFFGDRANISQLRYGALNTRVRKISIDPRFAHNFGKYYTLEENKPFFVVPNSEENLEVVKRFYEKNA